MLTIIPKNKSVDQLQNFLQSAIAPRPIALASTVDMNGNPNVSPFSFFNIFSTNPPILIFSPARRVRNNTTKHTLENILATKEVVINVVNYDIVQQTSLASTEYPEGVNEFIKAGFKMLKSTMVKPFRVAESPVQFECRVNEVIPLGKDGGAGNLVIAEILCMHIDEACLDENGNIDQQKLDLVARAGGNYYSRAKEGFFSIPKPIQTMGIGIDQLPENVRKSIILSGNDLALLGNAAQLPDIAAVNKFLKENPEFIGLNLIEKHIFAKELIKKNDVLGALKALFVKDI